MSEPDETIDHACDPNQARWRLARRTDLENVLGFVISVPSHGQDSHGIWKYGRTPHGGVANEDIANAFHREMHSIIASKISNLVSEGLITRGEAQNFRSHSYSVGSAAQEWPQFFFQLYQDAQPFLPDGASLLQWGYFLKDVIREIVSWGTKKQQEVNSEPMEEGVRSEPISVLLGLTQADLIALTYSDAKLRYGLGGLIQLDVFPRSYTGYSTPSHPAGLETYLIRIITGGRSFFYLVDGRGYTLEHYLATGSDVTLMAIPNLLGNDEPAEGRQPQPSTTIRLNSTTPNSTA